MELCIGKLFGIGIHHAFHIFPDGLAFCIEEVGEDGSGVIAAFAAESGAFVLVGGADESLCEHDIGLLKKWNYVFLHTLAGEFPIDGSVPEIIICRGRYRAHPPIAWEARLH